MLIQSRIIMHLFVILNCIQETEIMQTWTCAPNPLVNYALVSGPHLHPETEMGASCV
jgi:hypothetical protein